MAFVSTEQMIEGPIDARGERRAIPASSGLQSVLKNILTFAGPGYLVAVGYMDPGNWATDIAGGSRFGYALLPVIVLSSLTAIFLQWLSLRLGIASGRDLAQLCRERFHPVVAKLLWVACEVAIAACDLAEVVGTAIALKLLFHMPMLLGVSLTVLDTLLILALQAGGMRRLEALVIGLMAIVTGSFLYELMCAHPDVRAIAGSLLPTPDTLFDRSHLYVALGIFGATVMPHNLYLHSAVVNRQGGREMDVKRRIRFSTLDCLAALSLALVINAAILILAAQAFNRTGQTDVVGIEDAFRLLSPTLGAGLASVVFAVALLAAGQNSTLTGTVAGEVVMEGFLKLKMNPALRRLLTRSLAIVPALAVVWFAGEHAASGLLITSQVVLSLQLGFAVVPLVMFTSDRRIMGEHVNGRATRLVGAAVAAGVVGVNLWLVLQALHG